MRKVGHVRESVGGKDFRIGGLRRSIVSKTLCGAESTDSDFSRADARRLLRRPDPDFAVCPACAAALEDGARR